jgi:hypothetical protein
VGAGECTGFSSTLSGDLSTGAHGFSSNGNGLTSVAPVLVSVSTGMPFVDQGLTCVGNDSAFEGFSLDSEGGDDVFGNGIWEGIVLFGILLLGKVSGSGNVICFGLGDAESIFCLGLLAVGIFRLSGAVRGREVCLISRKSRVFNELCASISSRSLPLT